jgi:predicted transcriptional regulator
MSRPKSSTLTDGELRLMRVLWEKGESTVGEIVGALKGRPRPAYNTVLTLLRIMERKGYVTHRKDGRAFAFSPSVERADVSRNALLSLVNRFFDGSPRLLMLNLLEEQNVSAEDLEQLKARIKGAS